MAFNYENPKVNPVVREGSAESSTQGEGIDKARDKERNTRKARRRYLLIGFVLLSILFVLARCRSIALKQISPLGDLVYCNTKFLPSGLGWIEDDNSKHFILLYTFTPRYVDGCFLRFDVSVSPAGKVVQELFPFPDIEMSSEQRYNDARILLEQGAMEQRHIVEEGEKETSEVPSSKE